MNSIGRKIVEWLPALGLFAALIALWQFSVTVLGIREYLLPSPASVIAAMTSSQIDWTGHILVTGAAIFGAFVIAAVGGIALGTIIAWSSVMNRALMPFLVFVNTLPKVAVAPLFLLWLGYGILPNMLIGALIGFFPVVINTAVGLSQIDDDMLDLGRGRRDRGRVRRLPARPRLRDHYQPEQHEHSAGLRRPGLDLDPRPGSLRRRRRHVACACPLG